MASPELAVSKAAFSASLFKADPSSLTRQEVDVFFPLLDALIAKCSRHNVQTCKNWIMAHVAPSSARCANLARYLAALSKSLAPDPTTRPNLKRRRLHILYLLNDTLYHSFVRNSSRLCADAWSTYLVALVAAAASFDKCPKHKAKLDSLVSLWSEKQYFAPQIIAQIRDAVTRNGRISCSAGSDVRVPSASNTVKDAPYILPSSHGDSSTPWYDLPAATWLPHLTPNSTRPMKPDLIRPIQLSSGPPDATLVNAVKNLLGHADRIYRNNHAGTDGMQQDMNELGERVVVDEITGDVLSGDTYYGWSRQFCERMKARRKHRNERRSSSKDSRSRSYTRSRSSMSRSASRGRSESFPPSRKRPRRYSSDSRSRSRSSSGSRSRTAPPRRRQNHSRSRSRSRSRGRSTSRDGRHNRWQKSPSQPQHRQAPTADFGLLSVPPVPPPPPPPMGFHGQWPPPPPPLPGAMPPNWTPDPAVMSQMMAVWQGVQAGFPLPLPPPPPPQQQHHNFQQGGYFNQQTSFHQGYQQNSHDERQSYGRSAHAGGYNNNYSSSRGRHGRGSGSQGK